MPPTACDWNRVRPAALTRAQCAAALGLGYSGRAITPQAILGGALLEAPEATA